MPSSPVKIRSAYDPSKPVRLRCLDASLAKQANRDESDINTIMAKYEKTGLVNHVKEYQGRYEDVSNAVDYQAALHIVNEAQEMFLSLPSSIRKRFDNDPAEFLEFATNPANLEELRDLGLLPKEKRDPDIYVEPVEPSPSEPEPTPASPS